MYIKLVFLLGLLFSLACGGGGGGGGGESPSSTSVTQTTNETDFKFKSADREAAIGTWYSTSYNLDGTEYLPTQAKEIKMEVKSDGSWVITITTENSNGNDSTFVATSEGTDTSTIKINSFSYVLEDRKVVITENYTDTQKNSTHNVTMTLIKSGVPDEYVGNYSVETIQFNSLIDYASDFSKYEMSITKEGTMTEIYTYKSDGIEKTSTQNIHIGGGKVFIQNLVARQVGNVSLINGKLVFSTSWSNFNSSVNTFNKN